MRLFSKNTRHHSAFLTCVLLIFLYSISSVKGQYCTPIVSDNGSVATGDSVGIVNVTLGSINNNSAAKQGYENFTGQSTNLTKGRAYNLSVTGGYTQQGAAAWIDYNQNQLFEGVILNPGSPERLGWNTGMTAFTPTVMNFTVPFTAKSGNTRMRISSNELGFAPLIAENCTDIQHGDVEEYMVNLVDTFYIRSYQWQGTCVNPGSIDQAVLLIEVISTDSNSTFNVTDFQFNTNGCTNPVGDLVGAKLWYTDTVRSFNCANKTLFGSTLAPLGNFNISGSQQLVLGGYSSYFWLTYDIAGGATLGNAIDAECTGATIAGSAYNAALPTALPGNRVINNSSNYVNKEANIWYFTEGYGIDFNCLPPTVITDPSPDYKPSEGSASMCDKNGNLLFYTDGLRVFDRCHNQMPNGFGLSGSQSSMHAAIITPHPGNPNKYYIFNTNQGTSNIGIPPDPTAGGDLVVSEVDMTLNNGMGDVVAATKNDTILKNITSEAVTAVIHCNKKDIWVLVGKQATYDFYAYPITTAGIQAPIVSSVPWGVIEMHIKGTIKFSPNGKMLTYNPIFRSAPTCCGNGRPVLFDFDNSTGIVSNPRVLQAQNGGPASFSNDNSKLYIGNYNNTTVYQYDLCNLPTLTRVNVGSTGGGIWLMQNAPDGKIYSSKNGSTSDFLGVINSPNLAGAACNVVGNGFQVPGLGTSPGLTLNFSSAFMENYFNSSVFSDSNTGFTNTSVCFGDTTFFTDTSSALPGCMPQARSWKWYFGDPSTGSADTSFSQNASHLYSSAGSFTVTQIIIEGCESDTIQKTITVDPKPVPVLTSSNDSVCSGESSTLSATGGSTYIWSTGSTSNPLVVSPTITSIYSLTATIGNCSDTSSYQLVVKPSPTAQINSSSSSLCEGDSVVLSASGGNQYIWSTGSSTSTLTTFPSSTTTFTLIAEVNNCFDTTATTVTVSPAPTAVAGENDTICEGDSKIFNASGGTTYLWSTGSTNTQLTVSPGNSTNYFVVAYNGSCSDTDSVYLHVNPLPVASAGNNITVIYGESAILSASGGTSYQWSPADQLSCQYCPDPTVTPTVTTTYYVTVTDAFGCSSTDSIVVTVDFKCGFYVPNAFSPNNDGQNDVFKVQSNCITYLNLKVFDRWGNKVFETFDQNNTWDGTYNGKQLNTDVFTYYLVAELSNGESIVKEGNISLLK